MKTILFSILAAAGISATVSCASSTEANGISSTAESAQTGGSYTNITAEKFQKTVDEQDAIVIDVRTPMETVEGVIEGCDMMIDFKSSNFGTEIAKLDKSKAYVIYCRSGGRSASASQYMIDNGFKKVYNLEGGITGWTGNVVKP